MNGILSVVNTGPALQVGDTFNLFDGTLSGAFTATNLPALAQINHYWDTSLLASQGIITVALNALPVLPLAITDIARHPTNVVLTWNSYPTRTYDVEYLIDLETNNWTPLKTGIPATSGTNSTTSAVDTTGTGSGLNNTLVQYQMGTPDAQIQDATNTLAAAASDSQLRVGHSLQPECECCAGVHIAAGIAGVADQWLHHPGRCECKFGLVHL